MHIDEKSNYLFAVGFEDGEISIYDIGKAG